ncbi:hypothetical protein ACOJBM_41295 [Rhizobium beringeri]
MKSSPAPFPKGPRQGARHGLPLRQSVAQEGYRGYFDLDFLIDVEANEVYLGELNPRISGASSLTNRPPLPLPMRRSSYSTYWNFPVSSTTSTSRN